MLFDSFGDMKCSLFTRMVDHYMKLVGMPYLHKTLRPFIEKVYRIKKRLPIILSLVSGLFFLSLWHKDQLWVGSREIDEAGHRYWEKQRAASPVARDVPHKHFRIRGWVSDKSLSLFFCTHTHTQKTETNNGDDSCDKLWALSKRSSSKNLENPSKRRSTLLSLVLFFFASLLLRFWASLSLASQRFIFSFFFSFFLFFSFTLYFFFLSLGILFLLTE